MKKLLFIVCSLTMTTLMTACGDDDKDDNKNGDVTIGQLNKTTWASLAKINTFMNDFPAYDGEIDNHTITMQVALTCWYSLTMHANKANMMNMPQNWKLPDLKKHRHQAYRPYTRRPQQSV